MYLGAAVMDLNFWLPQHLSEEVSVVQANDHIPIIGGKGLNQAIASARLRLSYSISSPHDTSEVSLIGCVGQDDFGKIIRYQLDHAGVDTRFVSEHRLKKKGTGVVAILAVQGEKPRYIGFNSAAYEVYDDNIEEASELFGISGVICSTFEIPLQTIKTFVSKKVKGAISILNPDPPMYQVSKQPLLKDILAKFDFIICSIEEAQFLLTTNENDPLKLAKLLIDHGSSKIVITDGFSEAIFCEGELAKSFTNISSSYNKNNIGGATDAFIGGMSVALSTGVNDEEAISVGIACGALTTMRSPIAVAGFPDSFALDDFMRVTPPRITAVDSSSDQKQGPKS